MAFSGVRAFFGFRWIKSPNGRTLPSERSTSASESKDDLIAATLAHASKLALGRLESIKLPTNRDAMIDSLFAQIADWAATPRWSGAGFTRVVVELADLRGHPARGIARQHKTAVEVLVYPPPRVGKGFIAAQTGSRNHSADRGRDDAHAYSWRSQLC